MMAEKKKVTLQKVGPSNKILKKPTKEKPTKEKPTKEKPTKENPTKEKPTKENPTKENPAKEKPTKEKSIAATVRLEINLSNNNEDECVAFNYLQLLKEAEDGQRKSKKKDELKLKQPSGFDDKDDDDDDLDVARYYEAKYGNRKGCDYEDLGAGYEEDSFIDNTDAYDEMVPEEITTAFGGFYVNTGPLEFKNSDVPTQNDDNSNDVTIHVEGNKSGKGNESEASVDDDDEEEDEDDDDGYDDEAEEEIIEESIDTVKVKEIKVRAKIVTKRARSSPEEETKKVSRLPKSKARKVK